MVRIGVDRYAVRKRGDWSDLDPPAGSRADAVRSVTRTATGGGLVADVRDDRVPDPPAEHSPDGLGWHGSWRKRSRISRVIPESTG